MVSKVFRGRTPYIYNAECVISVRTSNSGSTLKFDFDVSKKKLHIHDEYNTTNERLYGKEYVVKYIIDKQINREEKIKIILNEELS
jgi:hypothetical protein